MNGREKAMRDEVARQESARGKATATLEKKGDSAFATKSKVDADVRAEVEAALRGRF